MRRVLLVFGMLAIIGVATFILAPMSGPVTRADAAAPDWLAESDAVAAQFTADMFVEGKAYRFDGPRRMAYYTPQTNERSRVFAGAVYAMHVNGNPEIIIAIESSGSQAHPSTYIEISRLSGAAMVVYRNGEEVAEFPRTPYVRGAYYGMSK